jgi:hypothetical protein
MELVSYYILTIKRRWQFENKVMGIIFVPKRDEAEYLCSP